MRCLREALNDMRAIKCDIADSASLVGYFCNRLRSSALAAPQPPAEQFQQRVQPWLLTCFGAEIAADKVERNHRFLEESLELVQSLGCTRSEAHQLVDYVFGRPVGESSQEVGGVMVTLAALCLANGMDMHQAGETELARIWTMVEKIRAKQAAKPKHSPLPGPSLAEQPAPLSDEQIEPWSQARFGVFHADGRFEELPTDDPVGLKHPLGHTARWVGGTTDAELLRAVRAELRGISAPAQGVSK